MLLQRRPGAPVPHANVHVLDANAKYFARQRADTEGRFTVYVPDGESVLLVPERPISSQYIGTPVSVDFSRLPDLVSLAGLDGAATAIRTRVWRLAQNSSATGDQDQAASHVVSASDRSRSGAFQRAGGLSELSAVADPLWPEPAAAAAAGMAE